jgi:hypothetical protein
LKRTSARRVRGRPRRKYYLLLGIVAAILILSAAYFLSTRNSLATEKPVILYVNQGNGVVNESNFASMLSLAKSHGFNTIFFQVYRRGVLLFNISQLQFFVQNAHAQSFRIFFALYFTNSTQPIPESIYPLGQDGINLDMSTLPLPSQQSILTSLQQGYRSGKIAITTTDFNSPLKPDLLILETYGAQNQQYIHQGIIASVGVFATTGRQDYEQQFQYALNNSDGVMVFDYAGLLKSGY